jgi:hypothetical protein
MLQNLPRDFEWGFCRKLEMKSECPNSTIIEAKAVSRGTFVETGKALHHPVV